MRNRLLLSLAAVAVVALIGIAVYYFQLTAPVQVASTPPVAPTLGVAANVGPTAPAENTLVVDAGATETAGTTGSAQEPTSSGQATLPPATTGSARVYRIDATQSKALYSVDETFFEGNRLVMVPQGQQVKFVGAWR